MPKEQNIYFSELTLILQKAGCTVAPKADDIVPVEWNGRPLCRITESGSIRYWPEDIADPDTEVAFERVKDIAGTVREYTALMEQAPTLKAEGLSENYKLLADFNGAVLAAQQTRYGVQFATWEWTSGRTGLWQGHYSGPGGGLEGYRAAKVDFCRRSGLVDQSRVFTNEQLAEVYRCVHETLESAYTMTPERQKLLEGVAEQVEEAVPNLTDLVDQSNEAEIAAQAEEQSQGMTQQM